MTFARCPEQAQVAALGGQASSGSNEAHGAIMMAVLGGCVGGGGVGWSRGASSRFPASWLSPLRSGFLPLPPPVFATGCPGLQVIGSYITLR